MTCQKPWHRRMQSKKGIERRLCGMDRERCNVSRISHQHPHANARPNTHTHTRRQCASRRKAVLSLRAPTNFSPDKFSLVLTTVPREPSWVKQAVGNVQGMIGDKSNTTRITSQNDMPKERKLTALRIIYTPREGGGHVRHTHPFEDGSRQSHTPGGICLNRPRPRG